MLGVAELAILCTVGMPLILGLAAIMLAALKVLKGDSSGNMTSEETQLMQDIHQGLMRMEKRIDALETLMFEQNRKDGAS